MKKFFILAILLSFGILCFVEIAHAVRITLKRVVFEGPKRTEVLTLINNSDKAETYRLGWRHFRMTENKSLVAVPDDALTPDIKPVVDMIRFAPRRFTIPPKSSQQVRMMLRMPSDLPDGEYRSHFWIRPEMDPEELRLKAKAQQKASGSGTGTGVSLTMLTGVTMPVIVRKGNLDANVTMMNLQASGTKGFVTASFSLLREGQKSVYGDLDYICNPGASQYILRTTRGIAIYPEINKRNFNLRIERLFDQPHCSTLAVQYTATTGFKGKRTEILAEGITSIKQ